MNANTREFPRSPARGLGTAVTYPGLLEQSGALANGTCDLQFSLFGLRAARLQKIAYFGDGVPPRRAPQLAVPEFLCKAPW